MRRDKGAAPATEIKEFAQVDGQVEMTKGLKDKPGALTPFYPPSLRADLVLCGASVLWSLAAPSAQ